VSGDLRAEMAADADAETAAAADAAATTDAETVNGETDMESKSGLPQRLHHTAYVSKDLEKTRQFYEEIIGIPLAATWCECEEIRGEMITLCHVFFELADGSALAFFQFADARHEERFGPQMPRTLFHHIALNVDAKTQEDIEARLKDAGILAPDTYVLEHGFCRSLYVRDPNGMLLELTCDAPEAMREDVVRERRAKAHSELARWLAGDHTPNNPYR
jgi:glyoxylase I family protein